MSVLNEFSLQCHKNLLNRSDCSNEALRYLELSRSLNIETINKFKIGYCPGNIRLPQEIRNYGGAFGKDYSFFIKDRIIVPIFEEFNEIVVGIGTRKPIDEKFPWWNSPYPFEKGNNLFNLNLSRKYIFKYNKVYIVEGYIDAITLFQAGIKNVVAVLGTKLTLRHIGLLTRYCNEICFCFDVDKNNSGQNARDESIVAIDSLGICNKMTSIDNMPEGEDPASFVSKFGKESFLSLEEDISAERIAEIVKRSMKRKQSKKQSKKQSGSKYGK